MAKHKQKQALFNLLRQDHSAQNPPQPDAKSIQPMQPPQPATRPKSTISPQDPVAKMASTVRTQESSAKPASIVRPQEPVAKPAAAVRPQAPAPKPPTPVHPAEPAPKPLSTVHPAEPAAKPAPAAPTPEPAPKPVVAAPSPAPIVGSTSTPRPETRPLVSPTPAPASPAADRPSRFTYRQMVIAGGVIICLALAGFLVAQLFTSSDGLPVVDKDPTFEKIGAGQPTPGLVNPDPVPPGPANPASKTRTPVSTSGPWAVLVATMDDDRLIDRISDFLLRQNVEVVPQQNGHKFVLYTKERFGNSRQAQDRADQINEYLKNTKKEIGTSFSPTAYPVKVE